MKADTFYFQHDYEPTSDPKVQALIGEYGASGYGIYWRIVEMLHSNNDHKLPFKEYVYLAIAKQMLTSAEQIKAIIDHCINVCELFSTDGISLWSERVNRNLERRSEISEKRSVAGRAGAIAKQTQANASKGKESKVNNNTPPTPPKGVDASQFYGSEIEKSEFDPEYQRFVKFLYGEHENNPVRLENVLGLKNQMTYQEFQKVTAQFSKSGNGRAVADVLLDMENKKDLQKKYKSLYLTLIAWLKLDKNRK